MKKLSILLAIVIIGLSSCNKEDEIPTELADMKLYLKEKRSELKTIEDRIAETIDSIKVKDPMFMKKEAILVTIDTLKATSFQHYDEIQATVQADDIVNVSAEMGGNVTVYAKEGNYISRGALVAKVDGESIDKQINEVKKNLELANQIYERQKRLWDQKIGTEIQFLQAKNNKERLEKTLETIDVQKRKTKVYAPISGVVDKKIVESGEVIAPGQPLITILNERDVKVVADVSESFLGKVKRGQKVSVKFPSIDKEQTARVQRIGSTINAANRTFPIEIDVNNNSKILKPNLLATIELKSFEQEDALMIPSNIVQEEISGRKYLFLLKTKAGKRIAKKTYVETGESYEGKTLILKGLKEGAVFIVDGVNDLVDGEEIKL